MYLVDGPGITMEPNGKAHYRPPPNLTEEHNKKIYGHQTKTIMKTETRAGNTNLNPHPPCLLRVENTTNNHQDSKPATR